MRQPTGFQLPTFRRMSSNFKKVTMGTCDTAASEGYLMTWNVIRRKGSPNGRSHFYVPLRKVLPGSFSTSEMPDTCTLCITLLLSILDLPFATKNECFPFLIQSLLFAVQQSVFGPRDTVRDTQTVFKHSRASKLKRSRPGRLLGTARHAFGLTGYSTGTSHKKNQNQTG
jgi:hypothetical protein